MKTYDPNVDSTAASLEELVEQLDEPRAVWLMVPAGEITEGTIPSCVGTCEPGDTIIDGGNSYYLDALRRYARGARARASTSSTSASPAASGASSAATA